MGMAHYNNQTRPKFCSGKLNTANLGGAYNIAGYTNNKKVAQPLVKDDFQRDACIRTSQ